MAMLCNKCFCIDTKCQCKNNEVFEVDDSIAELISILNKKKYTTLYCCGGHVNKENLIHKIYPEIYIKFTPQAYLNLMFIPDFMECEFSTSIIRCVVSPDKLTVKKPNIPRRFQQNITDQTVVACEHQLEIYRKELLAWANSLLELDDEALDV